MGAPFARHNGNERREAPSARRRRAPPAGWRASYAWIKRPRACTRRWMSASAETCVSTHVNTHGTDVFIYAGIIHTSTYVYTLGHQNVSQDGHLGKWSQRLEPANPQLSNSEPHPYIYININTRASPCIFYALYTKIHRICSGGEAQTAGRPGSLANNGKKLPPPRRALEAWL